MYHKTTDISIIAFEGRKVEAWLWFSWTFHVVNCYLVLHQVFEDWEFICSIAMSTFPSCQLHIAKATLPNCQFHFILWSRLNELQAVDKLHKFVGCSMPELFLVCSNFWPKRKTALDLFSLQASPPSPLPPPNLSFLSFSFFLCFLDLRAFWSLGPFIN